MRPSLSRRFAQHWFRLLCFAGFHYWVTGDNEQCCLRCGTVRW